MTGAPLREVSELSFVADTRHGLALFPGPESDSVEVVARIRRRCGGHADPLRVVVLGREVDEAEANYMLVTRRLPRRVSMRLKK